MGPPALAAIPKLILNEQGFLSAYVRFHYVDRDQIRCSNSPDGFHLSFTSVVWLLLDFTISSTLSVMSRNREGSSDTGSVKNVNRYARGVSPKPNLSY